MKTSLVFLVFFIGTVTAKDAAPKTLEANPKAAHLDSKTLETLSAEMQKQVDEGKVAGIIGLIHRNGEVGYYETFGNRFIEQDKPMSGDTLFRIYSMTKPIVAVTAMSIWEEGKFKLDDPISDHLPEWKEPTVREDGNVVPATVPITPRHLLTHSSGLRYGKDGLDLGEETTLEEFSKALANRPLSFQPGTSYKYGYSTDLLGRYIEAVEGKPLDVVMRERVFDKLGMDDTGFWVGDEKDRGRVAMVYTKKAGRLAPAMKVGDVMKKPSRMMGGQGLISTAGDYAKFCEMLLNQGQLHGKRILEADTVKLMFKNHLKKIGKVYGLGGIVDGKGGYSWGGAAGTRFWVDTKSNSYAVFMIQTWGYKAPTFNVFKKLAQKAAESTEGAGAAD